MHSTYKTAHFRYLCASILCAGTLACFPASASTDVSSFGATGNGSTDDTNAIQTAINSVAPGTILTFGGPNQVFLISSRLVLRPNMIYQGQGTVRMSASAPPHTAIAMLTYNNSNNTTIRGITFDANGVGGGLQIAVNGAGAIPADSVVLDHLIFRNTTSAPQGAWDGAVYDSVGLTNSQITNNQVMNCAIGMYLTDPNAVTISNNLFQDVHIGDAIQIVFSPAPFTYGQAISITQNTGQHLGRMGIEVWPSGGDTAQSSQVQGIVVSGNTFTAWDTGYNTDTFGISMMAGQQNSIVGNKLVGPTTGFGIEMGAPGTTVSQNSITGFSTGIVLHDSSNSTVTGNFLTNQNYDGVEFSNAWGNRTNVVVQGNSIVNAQTFGIYMNTSSWGGTNITGNFIARTGGLFAGDSSQTFFGIATTPPVAPVSVTGNSIVQDSTNAPAQFSFVGIQLNGGSGANASSTYLNNNVMSQLQLTQSVGIVGNSPGSMDGAVIQGNSFTGLYAASGGAASSGAVSSGNLIYNCTMVGPIVLAP